MRHVHIRALSSILTLASLAVASGCAPTSASAIQPTRITANEIAADTPADPEDPYGSCLVSTEDPANAVFPLACSQGDADCTGWGGGGTCDEAGNCDVGPTYAICDHTCQTDADCPVPGTGNAAPVCLQDVHACQLPCDANTQCPDGYTCQDTSAWGFTNGEETPIALPFICMQVLQIRYAP